MFIFFFKVRDLCPQFAIFARSSRSLPAVRDLCPQFAIFARSSRSLPAVRDFCPQFICV
jgi:hypothetical protein